jgi:hypothetical protein
MTARRKKIAEAEEHNLELLFKDGPRLRFDYETWVVARDREAGMVVLGGLGGLGVGTMWAADERYQDAVGYDDAPEEEFASSQRLGGGATHYPAMTADEKEAWLLQQPWWIEHLKNTGEAKA